MEKIFDEIKRERIKTYYTLTIDLSVARSNEAFNMVGTSIYVMAVTAGLTPSAQIRLNDISGDAIELLQYRRINSPFYRFFITNIAQAGRSIQLAIGIGSEWFSMEDYPSSVSAYLTDYLLGTQIAKFGAIQGSGVSQTLLIHTVSAGKKLILDLYAVTVVNVIAGNFFFGVWDNLDNSKYYFHAGITQAGAFGIGASGNPTLSLLEGWQIKVSALGVNNYIIGFIKGREVDA
jgi:hypothetical protein